MKLIQKLLLMSFVVAASSIFVTTFVATPTFADHPSGGWQTDHCSPDTVQISVPVNDINDDGVTDDLDKCLPEGDGTIEQNPIIVYLKGIINFLAIGVGLVTVISIVVSGIQYMSSQGNPQGIDAAKKRLFNAVIALILFVFMYAILNFLVPGRLIG